MKIAAVPVSHTQLPSRSRSTTRVPEFLALMKPRVMLLAVFTAFVGLMIAPGHLDPLLESIDLMSNAARVFADRCVAGIRKSAQSHPRFGPMVIFLDHSKDWNKRHERAQPRTTGEHVNDVVGTVHQREPALVHRCVPGERKRSEAESCCQGD